MKLWSIEDDGNGNFFWQLEDSFDTSSLKKITLQCNNIEWIETYLYEDENGQSVQISKNHYFDNGTIAIPIESDFKISLFDRGSHQFSIYDLDGNVSNLLNNLTAVESEFNNTNLEINIVHSQRKYLSEQLSDC